ncbi:hypothetical protein [Niallia nealsonii]|uniref:Uncharacterized protein n=1 Tax=Niallia nealsonii TaxID=115979 RepID=A0A2N0YZQ8_9BACI|nr:hypothetical protein [Niallia nealsonii]PKG22742.1 hypothetical protein CWS01_15635 [Niallia nealsonii]
MSLLTMEQKTLAVDFIRKGKSAEAIDYLSGILTINRYSGKESRIFSKGFVKGYAVATEVIAFLVEDIDNGGLHND